MPRVLRSLPLYGPVLLSLVTAGCGMSEQRFNRQVKRADELAREQKRQQRTVLELKAGLARATKRAEWATQQARKAAKKARQTIAKSQAAQRRLAKRHRRLRERLRRYQHAVSPYAPDVLDRAFGGLRDKLRVCTARVRSAIPRKDADAYLQVGPAGRVKRVSIPASPYPRALTKCLVKKLRALRFGKPSTAVPVTLHYRIAGLLPDPSPRFVSSRERRARGCGKDADCVVSCLRPACCGGHCYCADAVNRGHVARVIAERKRKRCDRVRCPRSACPARHYPPVKAVCRQRLCTAVSARPAPRR